MRTVQTVSDEIVLQENLRAAPLEVGYLCLTVG